jgi:carbamoyl-phosphate synthase small subunit
MIGIRPLLGVGCGAALLASALGIKTYNLPETHFGTAIPVEITKTKKIYASYQAHSLTIKESSAINRGAKITERNVCDNSIEGFKISEYEVGGSFCLPSIDHIPNFLKNYIGALKVLTPLH